MVIRGFPFQPFITQTTTLWLHGITVWVNPPQKTTAKQLLGPHVYQGSPPPFRTQTTTPLHNTINYSVDKRNHCVGRSLSKNYWKTTLRLHVYHWSPLPFTTQRTTVWAYGTTVWVNSSVTTRGVLENNFKSPVVVMGFSLPLHTQKNHCVGIRNHCVG